jgi:hypothetical protein
MLGKSITIHSFNPSPLALAIGATLALAAASATALVVVDAPPDLKATKAQSVNGEVDPFYRNISGTPEATSTKSKLEALTIYVPAMKADGTLIEGAAKVHPMISTYTDTSYTDTLTGQKADDVFAAVSRDDGATWKHMNLSRSAEKSSIDVLGAPYYGDARKPSIKTDGNLILVSWTSKLCRSGDPSGIGDGEDLHLVKGPQGIVDYGETYDRPDLGVVPFSCLWVARGMINPADGEITWFAPEQVSSGRRDALQDVPFSAKNAGFALVWQEDPEGLDPGQAKGPGEGMSGATVNKQTDIWYSFITAGQFTAIDTAVSPEDGKPKPLYPFSSPVRLTDNASCKVENGEIKGLPICELRPSTYCATTETTYGADGVEIGTFCKTSYGVLLDGDTGASRPNLFMFPKTLSDGTVIAEAGLGYEETKGLGEGKSGGRPDDVYAQGKLVRYHHFPDFRAVPILQPGNILNLQAKDPLTGAPLTWDDGSKKYENARRVRFILQSKSGCGDTTEAKAACTTMVAVYKQGIEGQGRQSDVMMRRAVAGYEFSKFQAGAKNLSSPRVLATEPSSNEDGVEKVTAFDWYATDLASESWVNPYDDARAQRGAIRGNTLLVGFTMTPNWAAARNGNDHYDFYIRWSLDGGQTFVDPATASVDAGGKVIPLTAVYGPPRNISQLKNNKSTVIEPRTISTPGSIVQPNGTFYSPDDQQNPNVFHLAYGTASNVDTNVNDGDDDDEGESTPEDIFFTWTEDGGRTFKTVLNQSTGDVENLALAGRNDASEGEAQLRTVPSGLKLYAVWNHDGPIDGTGPVDGSDVGFRKIVSLPDLYDLSGDGLVDISDQIIFRAASGKCEGKNGYNPVMDYDNDKCITLGDYAKFEEANRADD